MASFKTTAANGSYPYLKETLKGSSNGFKNPTRDAATVPEDESHQIISSYFIGPRAENLPYFKENIDIILNNLKQARLDYRFDNDAEFIDEKTQESAAFKRSKDKLKNAVDKASEILGRSSIPFWSPRYQAHMCTDMSMSSLLGYFMTMLYNPNNVALEASPLTTVAEIEVGEQLCDLFGYNINEDDTESPTGWGHVTCDGTVANLESMCICPTPGSLTNRVQARNLKFYPLSLRKAFDEGQKLEFLKDSFHVETCQGERKLFTHLSTWELLNLKPSDVLDLPDRLYQEHGISNKFLSDLMNDLTIQSTGKDDLEREFGIEKPGQYMLSNTRHYSWPKGAAICGLGSKNVVGIPVDLGARLDISELENQLWESLENKQPVYAVVGIIGSTEEGAVDSLSSILALRKQFQSRGLSFLVHADAAWGGYFCSMLPKDYRPGDVINLPTEMGATDGFVPDASLRAETQEDLYAMRFADSITVDPHKAGYIPYPAGGLCYRDNRMRFLVTWTSPYLSRGSVTSIGIYGVEGSKPGASAMSAWLSNKTIGLTQEGYGALLGEVTWTCTRLSAEWASLTDASSPFICVPFNMLPSELEENATEDRVEAEKKRIRNDIVLKSNASIMNDDQHRPDDQKAIKLMRALGSDLNINAFSLNFRYADGCLNDDIEEANYLMQRVVETFSVDSPTDDPTKIPLYLTSTEFSDELYGKCKANFVKRLGLSPSTQDLMVLRNVVMSPFPSDGNFTNDLAEEFKKVVEIETEVVRKRNTLAPDFHKFLIQGTEKIYLIHRPMFHVANHRQQLIMSAKFDDRSEAKYADMKHSNPSEPLILVTKRKVMLKDIAERGGKFEGQIMTADSGIVIQDVTVTLGKTVVSRPLNSKWRLEEYPSTFMPFYLYGTPTEANIDHVIVRAPNTQLSAGRCDLKFYNENDMDPGIWNKPLVLLIEDVREAPMQPFPPNNEIGSKNGAIVAQDDYHRQNASKSGSTEAKATQKNSPRDWYQNGRSNWYGNGNNNFAKNVVNEAQKKYLSNITCSRCPKKDANGNSDGEAKGHNMDDTPEPHTKAKVLTTETRSGAARGSNFFFRPGATFKVGVWEDKNRSDESSKWACYELGKFVGRGTLTLGDSVFVDSEAMNFDPFKRVEKVTEWRREFDQIGKELA
ncbi:putative L-tyrosine/L-aspartate decarboxylase [Colletotrichum siamense]|uniref:putative L-tyrosine/L-aspartate decarboxylase n=1 Tax=Colletotrichum siamense TaxID=690259 RepID=UPI0018730F43|nr:putative L-tyrosine/L-aspartate decarboxylase [Colletotrichum siamense]KAF5492470.1 putative L-tyrosine/L-aspartate decarboxylase [Colletotrichum siamense]